MSSGTTVVYDSCMGRVKGAAKVSALIQIEYGYGGLLTYGQKKPEDQAVAKG
jgi:hypothetical protein